MTKTYAQLTHEIEALKTQAEAVLQKEKLGVAARIREAIAIYGLTAEELGFGNTTLRAKSRAVAFDTKAATRTDTTLASGTVKYRDDAGNAWGGRGPRPRWLKTALSSGRTLDSFAVGASKAQSATASALERIATKPQAEPGSKKAKQKFKTTFKYRDGAGNQWSGRGPKPGWVKMALDAGTTLEQLAV